jgi:hypothetical protein
LLRSHACPRRACELHTHNLWQSLADANGDTDGHSYTNGDSCRISYTNGDSRRISDCNGYGNSHSHSHSDCNCDCAAEVYADA